MLERRVVWFEPGVFEELHPLGAPEEAFDVAVVFDTQDTVALSEQVGIVDDIGGVGRVRIPSPCQVTQCAMAAVVAAMACARPEIFPHMIRSEECGAPVPAVDKGRLNRAAK